MSSRFARSDESKPDEPLTTLSLPKTSVGLANALDKRTKALVVSDIAELLNISERQVYKLVAEQRIPCFKIYSSIRFDPSAISSWLREKMALASEESLRKRKA